MNFPIPSKSCQEGSGLCLNNAIRLSQDTRLLYKNERYLTSYCLATLALEEIAKGVELLKASKNGKDITKTKWTELKAHKEKIRIGRKVAMQSFEERFRLILKRLKTLPKEKYDEVDLILADTYKWLKEKFLYVDWDQNNWTAPMKFRKADQIFFATFAIKKSFESCKFLAQELGRDTLDIEKALDELSQRLNYLLGIDRDES